MYPVLSCVENATGRFVYSQTGLSDETGAQTADSGGLCRMVVDLNDGVCWPVLRLRGLSSTMPIHRLHKLPDPACCSTTPSLPQSGNTE